MKHLAPSFRGVCHNVFCCCLAQFHCNVIFGDDGRILLFKLQRLFFTVQLGEFIPQICTLFKFFFLFRITENNNKILIRQFDQYDEFNWVFLCFMSAHGIFCKSILFVVFYPGVDFDFQLTVCLCNYVQLDTGQ